MKPKNKAEKPVTEPRFEFVQCIGATQKGQEIEAWIGVPVDEDGMLVRVQGRSIQFDNVTLGTGKKKDRIFFPKNPVGVKV